MSDSDISESTETEIMDATKRTITEHGVSGLTTQRIADEWGKSQSLLHYYYDTKRQLLASFVDYLRRRNNERQKARADDSPWERIRWSVGRDLTEAPTEETDTYGAALFELHAQSAHEPAYREELNRYEDDVRAFLEDAIRDGIEDGTFRDVNPTTVATHLLSLRDGALLRTRVLGRDEDVATVRASLETYLRDHLLADGERDFDLD